MIDEMKLETVIYLDFHESWIEEQLESTVNPRRVVRVHE